MNQLFHDPFLPEARSLGRAGTELSRYSACLKRWAEFFILEAHLRQVAYEKARKEYLAEQASHARTLPKVNKTHKKVNKVFAALVAAGLSKEEALAIASL